MEFDLATALMPFRFGFMQNAFLISIIVSVPTALLSCFLAEFQSNTHPIS